MGKIMEALFCVFYMILVTVLGIKIVKNGKSKKEILWFGVMSLVLVSGDAFHLVPRVLEAIDKAGNYHAAKGIGTLITSVTMTLFYLMMYYVYSMRYEYKNKALLTAMISLTVIRIALCLLPQNDWTGDSPGIWGIYRNIPFLIMGIIMVVLFFRKRNDKAYSLMYAAIILSFLFYIPVVLWADANPIIGMFMLPKTCMYIWIVCMGYKESKKFCAERKTVVFLGSSVTYGSATGGISFADYICERNGLTMVKEAVSGTTLVDKDDQSYVSRLRALDVDACDLFVCQLSTNDASLQLPLNDVEEAIDNIIGYVKNKWNCPMAFYTNPKYDSAEYAAMVALMKEKAIQNNICLMNMWDDEQVNQKISENRDYYMADPIHPTKAGYLEVFTTFMEKHDFF